MFAQIAFVKFSFNAWNTSHRFGKTVQRCHWCGVVFGDTLEHYSICLPMLHAMTTIRPLLRMSWCRLVPPIFVLGMRAFGVDLSCTEEAVDLLEWFDFMHNAYTSSSPLGCDLDDWHRAWKARQRILHRYRTSAAGSR